MFNFQFAKTILEYHSFRWMILGMVRSKAPFGGMGEIIFTSKELNYTFFYVCTPMDD